MGGSLCPGDGTGTFQNIPTGDAWAMGRGQPAPLLPAPSPIRTGAEHPGSGHSRGTDPCSAEEGSGDERGVGSPISPPRPKEQPQALLHSVAARDWELLQEKRGKKGKKAGFRIRDHANRGQAQPHTQQSSWDTGSPATAPINARDGSEGAADSTVLIARWAGSRSG